MIFLIRQLVRMIVLVILSSYVSCPQLHSLFPSALTKYTPHDFSDPSARTHRSCDLSRVMSSTAFTVCALTKYTPPFLINGFSAKCVSTPCSDSQLILKIGFVTFTTVSSDRNFQSVSVFLDEFSVGTSETSRTIRLFQFGGP